MADNTGKLSLAITGSATRRLTLDAKFSVEPTQRVAIIGHNGSGKTSILRLIAGLDYASPGTVIQSASRVLASDGIHLSVPERQVPMTFAEPRLFPHMSVLKNLTFGPAKGRRPTQQHQKQALDALVTLGIAHLAHRPASELSSGQSAAIAVLRTVFAPSCAVLLDEPFSALDTAIASEVRSTVRSFIESLSVPLLIATHNPLDVMSLATHVAVMERGKLTQFGPVAEVARRPRSEFAAQFLGLNLLRGTAAPDGKVRLTVEVHSQETSSVEERPRLELESSKRSVAVPDTGTGTGTGTGTTTSHLTLSTAHLGDSPLPIDLPTLVAFSPASVTLSLEEPHGSAQNTWLAPVSSVEQMGSIMRVVLAGPIPVRADITTTAALKMHISPGQQLWVSIKATSIEVYPA